MHHSESFLCLANCSLMSINITNATNVNVPMFSSDAIAKAQYFWWICYPLLLACCTIGNLLNLVVLIREAKKSSTNSYMIAMAVSDLFVLWFYFPVFMYNISSAFRLPYHKPEHRAILLRFMGTQAWVQETFMHLCDWVLLMFSAERLLAFLKPFWIKKLTTAALANFIVMTLFALSATFCLELFVFEIYKYRDPGNIPAWLEKWEEIHHAAELSMNFSNFFILLAINCFLIAAINRRQKRGQEIGRVDSTQPSKQNRSRNTNILLLSSAALYLVCQFPSLLVKALALADELETRVMDKTESPFAAPFCNVTLMANYSVNFLLYLTVSKRYRKQFKLTLLTCCLKGAPYLLDISSVRATESEMKRQRMLQYLGSKRTNSSDYVGTDRIIHKNTDQNHQTITRF